MINTMEYHLILFLLTHHLYVSFLYISTLIESSWMDYRKRHSALSDHTKPFLFMFQFTLIGGYALLFTYSTFLHYRNKCSFYIQHHHLSTLGTKKMSRCSRNDKRIDACTNFRFCSYKLFSEASFLRNFTPFLAKWVKPGKFLYITPVIFTLLRKLISF